jgi:hypothetical protein
MHYLVENQYIPIAPFYIPPTNNFVTTISAVWLMEKFDMFCRKKWLLSKSLSLER